MKTIQRLPRLFLLIAIAVATVSAAGIARAESWTAAPKVPPALAVPATPKGPAKVVAHFHGVGAQVYACTAAAGTTTYAWTLQRPDAALLDQKGGPAGTHGAGPIWTAKDGSTVTGKKIAQADAPAADAIPWLLLKADKTTGDGIFSKVTYLQRVATNKGKPPATRCDATTPKTETRVDYSADYYFYN
jgi:hypothetical protein